MVREYPYCGGLGLGVVSPNVRCFFCFSGDPYNEDDSIRASTLGPPAWGNYHLSNGNSWKLPYDVEFQGLRVSVCCLVRREGGGTDLSD